MTKKTPRDLAIKQFGRASARYGRGWTWTLKYEGVSHHHGRTEGHLYAVFGACGCETMRSAVGYVFVPIHDENEGAQIASTTGASAAHPNYLPAVRFDDLTEPTE